MDIAEAVQAVMYPEGYARWERSITRLTSKWLEDETICDTPGCNFLADYFEHSKVICTDGYTKSYIGIICGGCARKFAKKYKITGPWEKS